MEVRVRLRLSSLFVSSVVFGDNYSVVTETDCVAFHQRFAFLNVLFASSLAATVTCLLKS